MTAFVRTRFAPSPTGDLHLGGARTALFAWLWARQQQGSFILRIEDTDTERSTQRSIDAILQGMAWLGLSYDEGPFYQTQRFDRYRAVLEAWLAAGVAYRCDCSKTRLDALRAEQMAQKQKPRYDGHCRERKDVSVDKPHVIRFKTPQTGRVSWQDLVKGRIEVPNTELDDLILARSDGVPTYNFTVVVDDHEMRITHVVRGDDHVNNTPRQIHLLQALNAPIPQYAHVPMILGEDGKRLSKRHGADSVMAYQALGYLPEALLNALVRLGWSHGDQEIFSRDEMVRYFSLDQIQQAPAAFNVSKLRWLNQHYLKQLPIDQWRPALAAEYARQHVDVTQGPDLEDLAPLMRDRVHTLVEWVEQTRYFFGTALTWDPAVVEKHLTPSARPALQALLTQLKVLPSWTPDVVHACIHSVSEQLGVGMGKVAMPLRVAITGQGASPSIQETVCLIGRDRVLARLKDVLDRSVDESLRPL